MVLYVLNHRVSQNIEVVTYPLLKTQYSYKQAYISFFVNRGPQMLTFSVIMVLFNFLVMFVSSNT